MQRVQRKFGTLLKRSEDRADVSNAIQEFQQADKLLDKFMDSINAFQTAWGAILRRQLATVQEFEILYRPIEGAMEPADVSPAPRTTPKAFMDKCVQLRISYTELEKDLQQETAMIESKLLCPARDAKESVAPWKKTIKKREDRKLDFERYHSRVENSRKKGTRSPKEEAALAKHEMDLSQATYDYEQADEQLKSGLPPVIEAIFALIEPLLTTQIMLQHTLVAQLYTVLHEYCQTNRFPSPSPAMEQVVATWEAEFMPVRQELETMKTIAGGKAVNQPMTTPEKTGGTVTGLGIRNRITDRRTNSQGSIPQLTNSPHRYQDQLTEVEDEEELPPQKPPRPGPGRIPLDSKPRISSGQVTLNAAMLNSPPENGLEQAGKFAAPGSPWANGGSRRSSASTPTPYLTPASTMETLATQQGDYFGRARKVSSPSIASSIAAKKKPPPPPAKRIPSSQAHFVTALYDFDGQGQGDLSFREGDLIKVVKKSDSTDDWWLGELKGVSGSFPANYVKIG